MMRCLLMIFILCVGCSITEKDAHDDISLGEVMKFRDSGHKCVIVRKYKHSRYVEVAYNDSFLCRKNKIVDWVELERFSDCKPE